MLPVLLAVYAHQIITLKSILTIFIIFHHFSFHLANNIIFLPFPINLLIFIRVLQFSVDFLLILLILSTSKNYQINNINFF